VQASIFRPVTATLSNLNQALIGRYAIDREIGAGGMALVYLATDLKHHRPVAIKVLRPELAATIGGDRFLREIEFAAQLSHPHILPLFDSGAAGDLLYYVMPFVGGESLRGRLTREGALPVEVALRLAREIASAIGFAHHHGVVHRDVKPENILLADDIALVADFGIARAVQSGRGDAAATAMTAAGFALGTPAYMSPEQFTADEVDGRADIYSLGCVLYEMLAGEAPFSGATMEALLRKHLTEQPRALNEIRPEVSKGLARVVARSLSKDPNDRFPTAASFAEAIATVTTGGATPPEFAAAATPNNLPRQRTRFIGRERELAECQRLLRETRLLTLTGIGGSGKTRLALHLAETVLPDFPDGVWLVDLAALGDPQRLGDAVAEAIGAHEAPDKAITDVVVAHLAGKRALMLLDNCEHVLDAVAALADTLLARVQGLSLIATSREGLGVEGEHLLAVRSMTVPSASGADTHALEESDAVKLFVDRARAVRSDFSVAPDNAAAVAEICRRLDGIPLALELAAARVKVLSVEQIRARLDDRFRLLTGGRSAVPRQQTLLATMQWSYEQLSEDEQRLLRMLSVFAGGWRLAAATAVAGAESDEFEVLDVLARLVDKSLLLVEHVSAEETRYTMLETVRQYAHERLVDAAESETARKRHFEFHAAKAENFHAERFVREEYWAQRLTGEHDNLRAALAFARDTDAERYLEMAGALGYFWWGRSHMTEGREHIEAALAMTPAFPARPSRARALQGLAMIAANQGDAAVARTAMEEGLAMWRELGDPVGIAVSLEALGWAQFFASEDEPALATFEELLRIVEPLGDPVMLNRARLAMAQALVALSRTEETRVLAHKVLEFAQAVGDPRSEHSGFHFLADCALLEGKCEESLDLYRKSLLQAHAIGARFEMTAELEGIAMSLAGLGEHAPAVRLVAASRAEWARLGVNLSIRFWDELHERYMTPARALLGVGPTDEAERAGRAMSLEGAMAEALATSAPGWRG
jgi:predicted ATPase